MTNIFYDKTVTIWNKYVNGKYEEEIWIPTLINNVRLLVSAGNNIMKSGLESVNSARLHIDDHMSQSSKPYIEPTEWMKLPESEKANYYTLESVNDSFFVEGDTTTEDYTMFPNSFYEHMKQTYNNCFRINEVDRFGLIPHFECWGK